MIKNIIIICLVGSLIWSVLLCNHYRFLYKGFAHDLEMRNAPTTFATKELIKKLPEK